MIELIAQDEDEMVQWFWNFHGTIVRAFQSLGSGMGHSMAMGLGHATLPAMKTELISREPVVAYVALGANLGFARSAVLSAVAKIASLQGVQLLAQSALYQTAPLESSGDDYINAVIKISTTLPAYSLLSVLLKIEQNAGRERPYLNAPRTLDLDLLLYGSAQISSEQLTVPHPRMWQRAFVLLPLQEIAPDLVSIAALNAVACQAIKKIASC